MKIRDIIKEAKISSHPKGFKKATPGMRKFPQLDNTYGIYRFGIAMASSPDETNDATGGPVGNVPVAVAYSKGEEAIISATLGQFGETEITVTPSGSTETKDTYKQSPVAKPKRNKYGV